MPYCSLQDRRSGLNILKLQDLSVGYRRKRVISDISLEFEKGEFVSLLGPNGTGKTTLLRTISRHIKPVSGQIYLKAKPLTEYPRAELARTMAVVLTEKVAPALFSVYQFVALGRYPYTGLTGRLSSQDKKAVEDALYLVNAQELGGRDFSSLSDGQIQKLLIARAICQEPELLLLDEPTAYLDLKHRLELMSILRRLCRDKGTTILCSMHDIDIAAKISDRVMLLKDGAVRGCGYPEEVLTSKTVAWLYDFERACFDSRLGSIEISGDGKKGRLFVVAGMGTGACLYRMLAQEGYEITTGILLSNDVDYYVAKCLGAKCLSLHPGREADQDTIKSAIANIAECDLVINAGPWVDNAYEWNLTIIEKALEMGRHVLTMSQGIRPGRLNETAGKVIPIGSASQLFEVMEEHIPRRPVVATMTRPEEKNHPQTRELVSSTIMSLSRMVEGKNSTRLMDRP